MNVNKYCLLWALIALVPSPSALAAMPEAPPARSDELEDTAQPLAPRKRRSGREEDRVRALALFAAGRVAEQKQDFPRALRCYERAFRFDPEALAPLKEIVPLAFSLDRQAEGVRYALLLAERHATDPVLMRRLAVYLTEEGETARAMNLYEKALVLQAKEKLSANLAMLSMEAGRLSFLQKSFDASARHFAQVMDALNNTEKYGIDATTQKALLGKAEVTYQLFGEAFLEANRADDALAAFEKAHAVKADEAVYAYNLARVAAKRKQPAQALARLQTYFDKHAASQGTDVYQLLADLLSELGQGERLFPRLEELRTIDPNNMPLSYFLAQRYREAGQLDKAEPIYVALLETFKARPPLEAYQGLLDIYRQQKDVPKLLSTLGSAVGRIGSLAPLGDSVKSLLADGHLAKGVIDAAEQQLQNDPASFGYGGRLATALLAVERKDFDAADAMFEAAVKSDAAKASQTLVTWGLELFMANEHERAATIFQRGIEEKAVPEGNPSLYFYLAGALEMDGKTDQAIDAARKAAEIDKRSARYQGRVAWIEYHAKRYEAARQSYQALIDKFDKVQEPAEVREVLRDARLVLSNIAVHEEKFPQSEEWLEQVLDEFPEDVGALNDLGYLWADGDKHLELALQMIQVAVSHEPKNMAYRDSLGWVFYRLGRYPEAVAELRAAAGGDEEPDGVVLDHLAQALHKSGNASEAVKTWRRAAEIFDKHSEPDKAKEAREKASKAETDN